MQIYHEENKNFAFGEFKFGPLFMRLCYELGLEEMAAATLTDKKLRGFFNEATSFNIAIDMLFTKGCYESALEILRDMKSQGNTPESFKMCSALTEEAQAKGHSISRHSYCFAVALALRQKMEFAQEVVELLCLRSADGPHRARVGQTVLELQQTGQVTQQRLDDMLCDTPPGKKTSLSILEDRRGSRRTLRPLQHTLLTE
ncbi:hypothetical protein NHX12_027869 [Muraenolepis orangiensis]|uniref:Pentatricopeptide repeat-containing protein 2, mitochondrial n=1 Tax=Muraenolepis orangiensis TaxID=630683 RepID=A0A9Q0D3L4_9TELE|nr:hypothetical protein NHX12_016947 [Muraenolepis orangiensis]KAJ3605825.1 hypothetical protein NHX12_027869 [Muraenolepis orangiensis]